MPDTRPLRIVIAPDSFKGSVSATAAAHALAEGWRSIRPDDELVLIPQADGGEGTLDAIEAAVPGSVRVPVGLVTGPDGRPTPGEWLRLPDGTGVVELAQMSGLPLMRELDPLGATSRGLGEVMAHMLDAQVPRMLVGLGGSASTDGGMPVLDALGNRPLPPGGAVLLTDVRSPLLGPSGSAAVFAPQKGATPSQVAELEQRLRGVAEQLLADPDEPGVGAAGGVAFGLRAWGAEIRSGFDFLAELTGLREQIARADLVITGEGRFDAQSLEGKVVGQIAELAQQRSARLVIVAGSFETNPGTIPGVWHLALTHLAGSSEAAIAEPEYWLREAGAQAAEKLSVL
jgi:glycerate kinase